ncbi:MAG TPA: UDP-N-acetylmuramoyl-tripeptide--D-alanyl-D-alanine ligase [Brevefilum sp.]|nr:UDP-N-acetylmuramoyl-tripeptide--D-alanyl-D-alanine ligase [Brevefilum sp.]HOR19194.1 UDP-N-acetylmuramoyl-tripeptide--D-alanyl-D-alanine ligase [Brevefilum sp.]HPL69586.1 UDP-N-acetylmuramoyl-tripeptide--D-alanyl-D-alanine ligase [Brevefilum sp.]
MMMASVINLKDILYALTGQTNPQLDIPVSKAVIDSRQATEGSLFIAFPGEHVDGHDYVHAAFDNGAKIALIEKDLPEGLNSIDLRAEFFQPHFLNQVIAPVCLRVENTLDALHQNAIHWRKEHPIRIIGITGSVGKTSTKELAAALLSQKYAVLKNPGNRNNVIGLPLTLLELDSHHQCAVLEMGFYVPGDIRLLCNIAQPQVGVITNIGTVHAERAGSQENIASGKAELIEALPPAPGGVAILNMDDPRVSAMHSKTTARILSYGINEKSDLMARDIQTHELEGVSCVLSYQGKDHPVHSPLMGAFSVYTILCATAVALTEGLDWEMITTGLANSQLDLRLHPILLADGTIIIDDTYNASPASTLAALEFLQTFSGQRVAILGDMMELGQYERSGHYAVGTSVANAADVLILVGERTLMIADAAVDRGFKQDHIHWFADSEQAAQHVCGLIQPGDRVLIKGSNSMRMDRILRTLAGGE